MNRLHYSVKLTLFRFLIYLSVAGFSVNVFSANVYWVSTAGNDTNTGSQTTPFASINHALSIIQDQDTIRVMQGDYFEQIVINTLSGVTDFVLEGAKDTVRILSLVPGPVISVNYPFTQNTLIRNLYISHLNPDSLGVGIEFNATALTLEKCTIEKNHSAKNGGGIRILESGSTMRPVIRYCTIRNNEAPSGGGLYAENSAFLIEYSKFDYNNAISGNGGGMALIGCYDLDINYNGIEGNSAESGAGIYLDTYSVPNLKANAFQDNLINRNNALANGGGMYLAGNAVNTTFLENTFAENHADGNGGGLNIEEVSIAFLNKNIVVNNSAYQNGAGICLNNIADGSIELRSNQISGNQAQGDGGGIYLNNCNYLNIGTAATFQNNFYHNRAKGILNAVYSVSAITYLNLDYNYWGFRNIDAVQLQITIPGINFTDLIFTKLPTKITLPVLPTRKLYYFGDGFVEFQKDALPLMDGFNLGIDTQIDTSLTSGFNLNTLKKQYNFTFSGLTQNLPADLFLYFDQSELEGAGNPPKDVLKILAYNDGSGLWLTEPSTVDGIRQLVISNLSDLTNTRFSIGYETVSPDTGFRVVPQAYRTDVEENAEIEIHFQKPVQQLTLNDKNVIIEGSLSGRHSFGLLYDTTSAVAILKPDISFLPGEQVSVTLADAILETSGSVFGSGYHWQFEIGAFRGNAKFQPGVVSPGHAGFEKFLLSDLNNDGFADLIELTADKLYFYKNDGAAGLMLADSVILDGAYGAMAIEDLDNDDQKEIILVNSEQFRILTFSSQLISFEPFLSEVLAIDGTVLDVVVSDFDNNGIKDICLLVNLSFYYQANFYYGTVDTDYSFSNTNSRTLSGTPTKLKLTDVDANGLTDVIVNSGPSEDNITLLLNLGDAFNVIYSTASDITGLTGFETSNIWRLKPNDVRQEAVLAGYLNTEAVDGVGIYSMDADGQLDLLHKEQFSNQVVDIACADMTSDGVTDVVACQSSNGIQLLEYSSQNIIRGIKITPDVPADHVLISDLDLDGDMDLVVINEEQGKARWQILKNSTRNPRAFWVDNRSLGGSGDMNNPFPRINDALPRTLDGDTLFIFSGDYSEHLNIGQSLNLQGYGFGPVRLFTEDALDLDDAQIIINNTKKVSMYNFQLDRDTVDTVVKNLVKTGIIIENSDSVLLSKIGVYGFSNGISITSANLQLDQSYFESCNIGLEADRADINIREAGFQRNRIAGIWIRESVLDMENSNIFENANNSDLAMGGLIAENNSVVNFSFTEAAENGNSNFIINGSTASFKYGGIFGAYAVTNNPGDGSGIFADNASNLIIQNSVIADNEKFGVLSLNSQGTFKNNIFGKNDTTFSFDGAGLHIENGKADVVNNIFGYNNNAIGSLNSEVNVNYNDFFKNQNNFGTVTAQFGNLYENPLFVNDYYVPKGEYTRQDSGFDYFAFKLAPGSPLIDRGDPAIFNPDGSRSDMGLFGDLGSPFALDVKPVPSSFAQDTLLGVRWDLSGTASDSLLAGTIVFRSSDSGFIPDTLNRFMVLDKTQNQFLDTQMVPGIEYFYKLAFFDINGGSVGYSDEISNRLDFMDFIISQEKLDVQLGQEDTLRQIIQIKNTGTLPIRMQVLNDLPDWLTVFPMTRTIAAEDSANYLVRFSAVGMPRDTLLEHSITFVPEDYPDKIMAVSVQMSVSYRDLLPPKTELIGSYPDSVFQSVLNFRFSGNDSIRSTIGTPTDMLRFEYQLAQLAGADSVSVGAQITDQQSVEFKPLRDGRYIFRVAAIDTAGHGGLGTPNEVRKDITVFAGRSVVVRNVWQMVSPSRDISQIAQYMFDERVLAVKHWVDEEYADVKPDMLKYGLGYWIISKESGIIDMNLMNFVKSDTLISVELKKGWNQIGDPWAWNISLDSCSFLANASNLTFAESVESGVVRPEIYFNEILPIRQYRRLLTKSLSPKLGYWIYANEPVKLTLNSSPEHIYQSADILSTQGLAKSLKGDEILINLSVKSGEYGDTDNFIGLVPDPEKDAEFCRPALEPPAMDGYLQMYCTDKANQQSSDVRQLVNSSATSEWNVRIVRTNSAEKLVVKWDWLRQSQNYHFFLYHIEGGSWFDLENEQDWIIDNNKKINHLKLFATTDENFEPEVLPIRFELSQNYPNPFNMETTINLAVPYYADNQNASLIVYDVLGRKVRTLIKRKLSSGKIQINWDGRNDHNLPISSGLYFMRFTTEGFSASKKMVLIK